MHSSSLAQAFQSRATLGSEMPLPIPIYSVAQLRDIDRRAIQSQGIPGTALMARAGAAAFRALQTRFPRAERIAVICGPGNNGGDGYEVARLAKKAGLGVAVYTVGKTAEQGDAARMQ